MEKKSIQRFKKFNLDAFDYALNKIKELIALEISGIIIIAQSNTYARLNVL
jgi:hypothetical protein